MAVIVCSATDVALALGVYTTTIPFSVAALTSILSTPTPCRPITLRASAASMISPGKGAVRTTTPATPLISFRTVATDGSEATRTSNLSSNTRTPRS